MGPQGPHHLERWAQRKYFVEKLQICALESSPSTFRPNLHHNN